MSDTTSIPTEEDFDSLLQEVLTDRRPISDLLGHSEFLSQAKRICCRHVRGTNHNAMALLNDAYLKTLASKDKLHPDKTPNKKAFFGWFSVLALNLLNDRLRKETRERNRLPSGPPPDGESSDEDPENEIEDPRVDLEGDRLLDEFMEFTRTLPAKRRRALILRLENYPDKGRSFDEIAAELGCSNVTVRTWIRDSMKAFFDDSRVSTRKKALAF